MDIRNIGGAPIETDVEISEGYYDRDFLARERTRRSSPNDFLMPQLFYTCTVISREASSHIIRPSNCLAP